MYAGVNMRVRLLKRVHVLVCVTNYKFAHINLYQKALKFIIDNKFADVCNIRVCTTYACMPSILYIYIQNHCVYVCMYVQYECKYVCMYVGMYVCIL